MQNKMEIFAKLIWDNKIYLIILGNRNNIVFACYKGGQIISALNSDEIEMMRSVYDTLLINEASAIYLTDKIINGKIYQIFYDISSKNYFWKDIDGRFVDNRSDNIILNYRYNAIPLKAASNVDNKKSYGKNKYYTRPVKIGKCIATLLISSALALNVLSGCSVQAKQNTDELPAYSEMTNEELDTGSSESENEQTPYNFNELKQILEENPNIDKKTKKFLYKLDFVFDEYHQNMDMDLIKERLKTLRIKYDKNMCEENINWGGVYNYTNNEITIYQYSKFNSKDSQFLTCLIHEFFHVLQSYYSGRYTIELSNELFTRETLRRMVDKGLIDKSLFDNGFDYLGYNKHLYLYKFVASILPKEALANYQFNGDDYDLILPLMHIDEKGKKTEKNLSKDKKNMTREVRAYKLLGAFDELQSETSMYALTDHSEEVQEKIDYYYMQKNGISIEYDLRACVDHIDFSSKTDSALGRTLLYGAKLNLGKNSKYILISCTYAFGKTYFSDTHKENATIYFNLQPLEDIDIPELYKRYKVIITPELCEKYKEEVENARLEGRDDDNR